MITLKTGDRISEYILEEPLGKGGFGEVWRARHHLWKDRQVAVKVPLRPEAVQDLTNEGLIQATLDHPGIAKSLGMDAESDPPYFIVEFIDGRSLRSVLDEQQSLPSAAVLSILKQLLSVLEYAHERGVIHQDIKPENILLTDDGVVKLTDFGLGQTVKGESLLLSASLRTAGASPGGTIGYIAPEIRDHEGTPDGRADLYSVGILIFELLTGRRPAGGELPSELVGHLPPWCDRVFRGLYTRRDARFKDVAAVRAVLPNPPALPNGVSKSEGDAPPPEVSTGKTAAAATLVAAAEASRILGVSDDQMRSLVGEGKLHPVSIDGTMHYDRAALLQVQNEESLVAEATPVTPPPIPESPSPSFGVDVSTKPGSKDVSTSKAKKEYRRDSTSRNVASTKLASAGLFVRSIAALIDVVVAIFIARLLVGILGVTPQSSVVFSFLAYGWICHGVTGRTVGKLFMGIRVVTANGDSISIARSLIRSMGMILSVLFLGAGYLIIPFTRMKQGWHDFLAETRVVYSRW